MTDKLKERLYEIGQIEQLKKIYKVFITIMTIAFLTLAFFEVFSIAIVLAIITFVIRSIFHFVNSFQEFTYKTIMKNKISTIVFCSDTFTESIIAILIMFILGILSFLKSTSLTILFGIILPSIALFVLPQKLKKYFKEKIKK